MLNYIDSARLPVTLRKKATSAVALIPFVNSDFDNRTEADFNTF